MYAGKYVEMIGGSWWEADEAWLPGHCDLRGMGQGPEDVVLEHPLGTRVNAYTLVGEGDNVVSNLKVYTNFYSFS